ncbi:hypothetical protein FGIG_10922 [Fasciola gigantica]|uniref:Uncharacterized protein n=1 Tax=Fasciola gigantica TaxID=46835 RepID=A0A504Z7J4_FASGI|nr:hypothetical protein FGIG_10922 [Fasciola gigantica]
MRRILDRPIASKGIQGTDNNPLYVLRWSPSQLVGASTLRVEATVSCKGERLVFCFL